MNVAKLFQEAVSLFPNKKAIIHPRLQNSSLTFLQLDTLANKYAHQILKTKLKKGDKVLLFIKPSFDFHAYVLALFKTGLIPILIDPGMGIQNLLKCIKDSAPEGLIAEPEAHLLKFFFRSAFHSIKVTITTKKIMGFPFFTLSGKKMQQEKILTFDALGTSPDDTAAILFTSGGTGRPKGVVYTHDIFCTQTKMLQDEFALTSSDIDMAGFPLFSLFTLSMGMTSIIPDMNPARPSKADPKKLYQNIIEHQPTFVAGSPSIWQNLGMYCYQKGYALPSIKALVMFGAPVRTEVHQLFKSILTNGTTYTPYGATECLPISNISGQYILKETKDKTKNGHGTCLGFPLKGVSVKIIPISEEVIDHYHPQMALPPHTPGEIIVKSKVATKSYLQLPAKTKLAKIRDENDEFWHRMGDMGYLDREGKLWFLGRVHHRVMAENDIFFPIACEAIFNQHKDVKRSALVGIKKNGVIHPSIVIERKDGEYLDSKDKALFESELLIMAKKYRHTEKINSIYLARTFPVDVRHNIKIDRQKLKEEIEKNELES